MFLLCVRITRKLLLQPNFEASVWHSLASSVKSRAALVSASDACQISTQVAASDLADEDWEVGASHSRVGYLSSDGAAGPPHRRRADSQPALGYALYWVQLHVRLFERPRFVHRPSPCFCIFLYALIVFDVSPRNTSVLVS